jgi:hypothetical protein
MIPLVRAAYLLWLFAACGRIGFEPEVPSIA